MDDKHVLNKDELKIFYEYAKVKPVFKLAQTDSIERNQFLKAICDDWIVYGENEFDEVELSVFVAKSKIVRKLDYDSRITKSYQTQYIEPVQCMDLFLRIKPRPIKKVALKIVALDREFDLTKAAPCQQFRNVNRDSDIFYFADIGCPGTGAFSEYIALRRGFYNAKSFGITRCSDSFKFCGSQQTWPFSLDFYNDGIGDILRRECRDGYVKFVMKGTRNVGVDLTVADSVTYKLIGSTREFLDMKLLIASIVLGLRVLRDGGNAVFLWFSTATLASGGIFFLLYNAFKEVAIYKPLSSKMVNDERYFVCLNYSKEAGKRVVEHLEKIIEQWGNENYLVQCVPKHFIDANEKFLEYFKESSEYLADMQLFCYKLTLLKKKAPRVIMEPVLQHWKMNELYTTPRFFDLSSYYELFENRRNKYKSMRFNKNFFVRENVDKNFIFISIGKETSGFMDQSSGKWIEESFIGLPPGTIILAERLPTPDTFLVHDGGMLAYDDISCLNYPLRRKYLKKFLLYIKPAIGKFHYYQNGYKTLIPVTLLLVE